MCRITIRFYAELNNYLPAHLRGKDIPRKVPARLSVRELTEFFAVPPAEVDLVLINGRSVDFTDSVSSGDRISVYPVFESLSIKTITCLRTEPLRNPRFVCDVQLEELARLLRLLGLDVWYSEDCKDYDPATLSEQHGRILLTPQSFLLRRKNIVRGLLISASDPDQQAGYVLKRLDLKDVCRPFTRCTQCNALPEEVLSENVLRGYTVQPALQTLCPVCGAPSFPDSRSEKLQGRVKSLLQAVY